MKRTRTVWYFRSFNRVPGYLMSRYLGYAGLAGVLFFLAFILSLHFIRTPYDWANFYISEFIYQPYGWAFTLSIILYALANFALAAGLHNTLRRSRHHRGALLLFIAAAFGVLLIAAFPVNAGTVQTTSGTIHKVAVYFCFVAETIALYLFSLEFLRRKYWRPYARISFIIATAAAAGVAIFLLIVFFGKLPGVGERIALAGFLVWEIWISYRLIMYKPR